LSRQSIPRENIQDVTSPYSSRLRVPILAIDDSNQLQASFDS